MDCNSYARQILVADEGNDACDIMVQALAYLGYRAVCVTNLTAALKLVDERTWGVIFTELVLPGGNGFELLEAVRRSGLNDQTPVIALSGHHEFRYHATRVEFAAFVEKPVEVMKLRQVLTQLLPLTP